MNKTTIEWADNTWNPVVGCNKISPGCASCYAERIHARRHKAYLAGKKMPAQYSVPFEVVQLKPERLDQPDHQKKPSFIFVCSGSDLFHGMVPFDYIAEVYRRIVRNPHHTFLVLTKRPDRAHEFYKLFNSYTFGNPPPFQLPIPNLWLGVSTEDQKRADARIPILLEIPAAIRFVSAEPLLEQIDLAEYLRYEILDFDERTILKKNPSVIDWVICGGESGPAEKPIRPMHPVWANSLRNQCYRAGTKFFFKQWGEWVPQSDSAWKKLKNLDNGTPKILRWENDKWIRGSCSENLGQTMLRIGKKNTDRLLDGREWNEFPDTQNIKKL